MLTRSVDADGGVRSQIRTGLPVIGLKQGDFREKQRENSRKCRKAPVIGHFLFFGLTR
jgi:hypothetical protein